MVAVPALIPLTTPFPSTCATVISLLLHAPAGVPLLIKLMVELTHTVEGPLRVPAVVTGFTVTVADSVAPPQAFGIE